MNDRQIDPWSVFKVVSARRQRQRREWYDKRRRFLIYFFASYCIVTLYLLKNNVNGGLPFSAPKRPAITPDDPGMASNV